MAPKSQQTASTSSVSSPLHHSFFNALAESYFQEFMLDDKPIVCEIKFQPCASDSNILEILEQRNWGTLAVLGGDANVSVVREFYANLRAYGDVGPIMVRSRIVDFSEEVINTTLGLEAPTIDEYDNMMREGPDYETILGDMAHSRAVWTYFKEWCRFIRKNLIPTSQKAEFIKDRAVLLFCILTQHSINIGRIIHRNITSYYRKTQLSAHIHPVLITRLCAAAGVDMRSPDEIWIQPAVYGRAQSNGLAFIDHATQELVDAWLQSTFIGFSSVPHTPRTAASSSRPPPAYANAELGHMMENISIQQERMMEIITRIEQKMDQQNHSWEDDDEDQSESF